MACVTVGFLVFGASSSDMGYMLGLSLISFGGPGVQNAVIHLSNLFPASKSTIISIITGCFQLSFSIFYFFEQLWFNYHVTYRTLFLGYAVISALSFGASVLLWPDSPYDFDSQVSTGSPATLEKVRPPQSDNKEPAGGWGTGTMHRRATMMVRFPSVFRKPGTNAPSGARDGERRPLNASGSNPNPEYTTPQRPIKATAYDIKEDSLLNQLKSSEFIGVTAFLVVASFWANFYIGTIDLQLRDEDYLTVFKQQQSARQFTLFTMLGVTGIPVAGTLMDRYGFPITGFTTVFLGVVWSLGTLVEQPGPLVASFIAYSLFRTFTFNYFFAFLAAKLGVRYFGVLAGISFFIAGVVGFLQQPLLDWGHGPCHAEGVTPEECGHGNWNLINQVQLVMLLGLFLVPLQNWYKNQSKGRSGFMDTPTHTPQSSNNNLRDMTPLDLSDGDGRVIGRGYSGGDLHGLAVSPNMYPSGMGDVQLTAIQSKYNSSADEQWLVGDEQHTDGSASSAMV
mmetsp:Transcript_96377/g.274699  ORF Transcript_96377/g.274699 Transcript_96377/m.274699 type:complete len:508 (-) Transcript_96377:636-2159(-)